MLPSSTNASSSFRHFEDLRVAVESLQPNTSDQHTLVRLGIDPGSLPNTTILSYTDLLRRFQPGTVAIRDELDPGIIACLVARDACRGWELNVAYIANNRTGSFLADFFNFRRRTVTTVWRFNALILMADGVVVYRAWGGQPSVNQVDRRAKENCIHPYCLSAGDVGGGVINKNGAFGRAEAAGLHCAGLGGQTRSVDL